MRGLGAGVTVQPLVGDGFVLRCWNRAGERTVNAVGRQLGLKWSNYYTVAAAEDSG